MFHYKLGTKFTTALWDQLLVKFITSTVLANATRPETKINLKSFKILLLGFKKAFISGYITIPLKTFEYNSIGLLHIEKQFKALGGGFI